MYSRDVPITSMVPLPAIGAVMPQPALFFGSGCSMVPIPPLAALPAAEGCCAAPPAWPPPGVGCCDGAAFPAPPIATVPAADGCGGVARLPAFVGCVLVLGAARPALVDCVPAAFGVTLIAELPAALLA